MQYIPEEELNLIFSVYLGSAQYQTRKTRQQGCLHVTVLHTEETDQLTGLVFTYHCDTKPSDISYQFLRIEEN